MLLLFTFLISYWFLSRQLFFLLFFLWKKDVYITQGNNDFPPKWTILMPLVGEIAIFFIFILFILPDLTIDVALYKWMNKKHKD